MSDPDFRRVDSQPDKNGSLRFIMRHIGSLLDVLPRVEALTRCCFARGALKETFATRPHPA